MHDHLNCIKPHHANCVIRSVIQKSKHSYQTQDQRIDGGSVEVRQTDHNLSLNTILPSYYPIFSAGQQIKTQCCKSTHASKGMAKKIGLFISSLITNRKIEQFKKLQYTYPNEASHRVTVVIVQQVAQVFDFALINTQLLNHVIQSE